MRSHSRVPLILLFSLAGLAALAASDAPVLEHSGPVTPFEFDGDVRDLPAPRRWKPGDPIKEVPRRWYPKPGTAVSHAPEPGPDRLLELQLNAETSLVPDAFTSPSRDFPGQGYTGVNPPDTNGDVGPNHYIQTINMSGGTAVAIYDKATPTPALLATFALDSLGAGSCAGGLGDPVVIYDRQADRWLLSEFAGGNDLCVYISRTPNPVSGGWFAYDFVAPSFPDYPKYAVWPTDATGGAGSYLVTANDGGPGIYALDRGKMLLGQAASYQRVAIPGLPGFGFEAPTAADVDGPTPPPANAPAVILRHRDTESHAGPPAPGDLLEIWAFNVNWVSPASSTLTALTSINVSEFDSDLCGLTSFACFPQPGTSVTLDPLREVVMHRLDYFNFGDHQSIVGNFVTDVGGTNHGGVRWFELRGGGASWSLYQEGTYAIDAAHRWMGSIALDRSGNIALGYNVSSSSVFPSLRYTGRLAADPLGTMSQPESVIHAGTASNASNRYGDYAAMSLDPSDDCTFWFTGMDNTASTWRTQIASFRFDGCGCAGPAAPGLVAPADGASGVPLAPALDWSDVAGAGSYDVQVATDAAFVTIVRSASALATSDWTVAPALSAGTAHYWRARAVNACGPGAWSPSRSFTTCGAPAAPLPVAPANGSQLQTVSPALDWTPVAGAATYEVQVSTSSAFTTIYRSAAGLTASDWTVTPAVASPATYYWRARAASGCGTSGWSSVRSFTVGCTLAPAAYDAGLRVPRCTGASVCGCDSGVLLDSRDSIAVKQEPNRPNTINGSCADGTAGSYHSLTDGESVDRIRVRSVDGGPLRPGRPARVDVTVWCKETLGGGPLREPDIWDFLDIYYTSNAAAPTWTSVAISIGCGGGGPATFTQTFTLAGTAGTHAVRAQLRRLGNASTCTAGASNDRDDLAFRVDLPPQEAQPLEAGYGHSTSARADGTAWNWGWNAYGQLGDGSTINRSLPVRAGTLTGIVAEAAGVFHTVALRSDGTVWTWGGNADGQLGDGTTVSRSSPGQVPGLSGVVAIAAGANSTLALKGDGTVLAWGDNWAGQLGDGTTVDRSVPGIVPGLSGVAAVAAGFYHSVAVKNDGTVWTWGRNAEGELGDGGHVDRYVPGQVPGLGAVRRVACGAYFTLALRDDGTLRAWGHNYYGELGDGTNVERPAPVAVPEFGDVVAIAPGSGFSLAVRSDGTVWSWGQNVEGQLGTGNTVPRNSPGVVGGLSGVFALGAGEDHSLAKTPDGRVYGWGKNLYGQVGPGPTPRLTPVLIVDE
ncbi:MAG TPA: hypothetical protein VJS92_12285 [Candidatus Polarisedimenticolaceae bacterium]|nr:hypothetical protein [Candidatus Polarisedimenticolaceae bacterium]